VVRHDRLRDLAVRPHLPKRTVRLRLTALYGALFVPLGVVLVAITAIVTFWSLHPASSAPVSHQYLNGKPVGHLPSNAAGVATAAPPDDVHVGSLNLDLHQFLLGACITLAAMIAISLLLGWLLAGRVLRPLRTIAETTQNISEHDLHQRLALSGPRDELTELGDTIDGLLGRLQLAFDSQRRFVANASHELRTPLTVDRATLQVALSDPDITLDSLRAACGEVLEAGREQERLIDALLTLARSQRGLDHQEPVDLAAVTREVLHAHRPSAAARGLHVDSSLGDATVFGDARLLHQLVSNLVDNATRHNTIGGHVEVTLAASTDGTTLTVTNTGPRIPPDQVSRLLQPFQRGTPDRTISPDGLGLGLSIVTDIANAHTAHLEIRPRPEGGLTITLSFPAHSTIRSQGGTTAHGAVS
jgi:signal transduction histidine kinase